VHLHTGLRCSARRHRARQPLLGPHTARHLQATRHGRKFLPMQRLLGSVLAHYTANQAISHLAASCGSTACHSNAPLSYWESFTRMHPTGLT
jgi:hypothetical protein